jgi:serine protease Do
VEDNAVDPTSEVAEQPPAYCSSCGTPTAADAQFCSTCGARLTQPPVGHAASAPAVGAGPRRPAWVVPVVSTLAAVAVAAAGVGGAAVLRQQQARSRADGVPTGQAMAHSSASAPGPVASPTTARPTTDVSTTAGPTAPASGSFAELYENVQDGVVRISATTCDGGGIGTGFLVSPTLVATAAHVVEGAASLALAVGEDGRSGFTSGVVVGIDPDSDIALVRTRRPLSGHVFEFAAGSPVVGQEVAAIGFPEGEAMTLTKGTVSGLHRSIDIDGVRRSGLIQTDTAINPGNSGGPMLGPDGSVYGVVDAKLTAAEGIGYAVSPAIASARVDAWKGRTSSVVSAACDAPVAPSQAWDHAAEGPGSSDPTDETVVDFFTAYFGAINSADYDAVWQMLGPSLRGSSSQGLGRGLSTTFDAAVQVRSVTSRPGGKVLAHVQFTSFQAAEKGPEGDTCDNWDLDYLLRPEGESWQIAAVSGHGNGATHSAC